MIFTCINHPLAGLVYIFCRQQFSSIFKLTVNELVCETLVVIAKVIQVGSHKMLVRIANREDPDQTASSESV